jgi:hypothetical protein
MDGFYAGLSHPVGEPIQGLILATAGLLVARTHPARNSSLLKGAIATIALGMICAWTISPLPPVPATLITLSVALICAALVAALREPGSGLAATCLLPAGLIIGMNALPEQGNGMVATTIGSFAGSVLMLICISGCTIWMRRQETELGWLNLAPRVAASWCLAISAVLLAFECSAIAASN